MDNVVVLTRVCVDDFNIFKIWLEYHFRYFVQIGCCVFKRPNDNISNILKFLKTKKIKYCIVEDETFDNPPTFAALRDLIKEFNGDATLVVDCDEFFDDYFALEDLINNCIKHGHSYLIQMVDRVSLDGELYDIRGCKTVEDLSNLAPCEGNITKTIQKWETQKCCINKFPKIGDLHYPEEGVTAIHSNTVTLRHFKWRKEWQKKAKRRYKELVRLRYDWKEGLRRSINHFNK